MVATSYGEESKQRLRSDDFTSASLDAAAIITRTQYRPARVDFSQVCTAEEAAKEEAIRSAVSAVAESPDPR